MYDDSWCDRLVARERAALAVWLLEDNSLSTRNLADRLGMTRSGAWALMNCIGRVVPIYYDDEEQVWKRLPRQHPVDG